jgi:hypothetical protein
MTFPSESFWCAEIVNAALATVRLAFLWAETRAGNFPAFVQSVFEQAIKCHNIDLIVGKCSRFPFCFIRGKRVSSSDYDVIVKSQPNVGVVKAFACILYYDSGPTPDKLPFFKRLL